MQLTGIHHLTAISADAAGNKRFYTGTMGMRMVKKTVNQDDTSAYHLFYADGLASPGSDLTFFDWPAARERRGTHSIIRTGLRVAGEESLAWWLEHLKEKGVTTSGIVDRDGRKVVDFEDPEGQRLALVDDRPGVTRDRREGEAHLGDLEFTVVDTAGLEEAAPESLSGRMRAQTETAIEQADAIFFMIDARVGPTPADNAHVREARRDPTACASCHDGAGQSLCVGCHQVGGVGGSPHPPGWSSRVPLSAMPCRLCHPIGSRP